MIAFKIVDRTAIASLERRQVHGFGEVVSELNYAGWVSQSAGIFDIRHMCVCVNGTDLFQTRTRILMATRLRTYLVCASTLISQSKSQTNNKHAHTQTHTSTHTHEHTHTTKKTTDMHTSCGTETGGCQDARTLFPELVEDDCANIVVMATTAVDPVCFIGYCLLLFIETFRAQCAGRVSLSMP